MLVDSNYFPPSHKSMNSCFRTSLSPPRWGFSAWLLDTLPTARILIDFDQVVVPFVPVDFLHSEETRGHMLQLLSAMWHINQLSAKLANNTVYCASIECAHTAASWMNSSMLNLCFSFVIVPWWSWPLSAFLVSSRVVISFMQGILYSSIWRILMWKPGQ